MKKIKIDISKVIKIKPKMVRENSVLIIPYIEVIIILIVFLILNSI